MNALWRAQAAAIVGLELRKNFISKRGIWIYLLALAPPALVWLHSIVAMQRPAHMTHELSKDTTVLAVLFQVFFLRPALFFGCVGIFTYLFRGEVVERSLHYLFLSPVRREIQVAAKYAAGLATAVFFFGGSMLLTFAGMYAHYSPAERNEFLFNGPGIGHLAAYLVITVLACIGWGAVFLWLGIRYRNPIVPAVVLLGWESANLFLPGWLRKASVLHYLQALAPVSADFRNASVLFGLSGDTLTTWAAVPAVLAIAAAMLTLAARELRRAEIGYGSD